MIVLLAEIQQQSLELSRSSPTYAGHPWVFLQPSFVHKKVIISSLWLFKVTSSHIGTVRRLPDEVGVDLLPQFSQFFFFQCVRTVSVMPKNFQQVISSQTFKNNLTFYIIAMMSRCTQNLKIFFKLRPLFAVTSAKKPPTRSINFTPSYLLKLD